MGFDRIIDIVVIVSEDGLMAKQKRLMVKQHLGIYVHQITNDGYRPLKARWVEIEVMNAGGTTGRIKLSYPEARLIRKRLDRIFSKD